MKSAEKTNYWSRNEIVRCKASQDEMELGTLGLTCRNEPPKLFPKFLSNDLELNLGRNFGRPREGTSGTPGTPGTPDALRHRFRRSRSHRPSLKKTSSSSRGLSSTPGEANRGSIFLEGSSIGHVLRSKFGHKCRLL